MFSCSLLHEATPMRREDAGMRPLPFLYDDAAAAIRAQNNAFLGAGVGAYTCRGNDCGVTVRGQLRRR